MPWIWFERRAGRHRLEGARSQGGGLIVGGGVRVPGVGGAGVERGVGPHVIVFIIAGGQARVVYNQMGSYKTINTFCQSPSVAQIAAYVIFALQVLTFYIVVHRRIHSPTSLLVLHVLYAISTTGQVIFTLASSAIDPSDQIMIKYRNNRQSVENGELSTLLYCDICGSYVQVSSRHCRLCGRCSEGFDHHCIWINNCVGSRNYRHFFAMIIFTFLSMAIYITSVAVLWAEHNYSSFIGQMILLWIVAFVVVIFDILVLNLIILHVYLTCKGLTTYDFILLEREKDKQEKLEKKRMEREAQEVRQNSGQVIKVKKMSIEYHEDYQVKAEEEQKSPIDNVEAESNQTEGNVMDRNKNIMESISRGSGQNIAPKGSRNPPEQEEEHHEDSIRDSKTSIEFSHFFTRNKSLKILVNSDAVKPRVVEPMTFSHDQARFRNWKTLPVNQIKNMRDELGNKVRIASKNQGREVRDGSSDAIPGFD